MIFAKTVRLKNKWQQNVRIDIQDGQIISITSDSKAQTGDVMVDCLLPALANLHSHSFQRAMAGMTEYRTKGQDSFWTWRQLMYQFIGNITPEQITAFAALTFMEMQEAGYASVGEFHYVHHQVGGKHYDDIAELSTRIFAAAEQTKIGLTHLPVLYTYGGAAKAELSTEQKRFGNDVEAYETLFAKAKMAIKALPKDTNIGTAPHSLRATCPEDLTQLLKGHQDGPIHIHIAEQPKEVADIKQWLGATPVQWVMDNHQVNENWCLIHATHLTAIECSAIAASNAVVGLCPITEANLGDGPFDGANYIKAGGRFGIGSDSNVRISLTEELRSLEYSQRLRDLSRNVLIKDEGSVGESIYLKATSGGAQALARKAGTIEVGNLADLVAIDLNTPSLCALPDHQLLDGLCFAASDEVITDVWSAGRHCVKGGKHIARDEIISNYKLALKQLMAS